jgi:PAS domain S-box-containing protein
MDNLPKKKRQDSAPPLRFSERSFMAIFQAAPIPMSYAPMSGELLVAYWNDAWYQVFGYQREQVEGHGGGAIGMWCDLAERARFIELLQSSTDGRPTDRQHRQLASLAQAQRRQPAPVRDQWPLCRQRR